jgi:hypothetical protein
MDGKPKVSPTHTYVFDESDLEQLDDLSLSSMMEAVDVSALLADDDLEPTVEAATLGLDQGDEDSEETAEYEELIAPELLLGKPD